MVVRATTILCCLLAALAPAITVAQVMEHAHEHEEALLTGDGHSHEDGDTPHHEHEDDGSPIRADKSAGMVRVAPPTFAKILIQPTEPVPFASPLPDAAAWRQTLVGFLTFKEHIPPPNVPSPGDTLPLLI
jgi:hypothetical protein